VGVSVREFIEILLTVARRRWLVILLPILIFTGLSVLAAKYWPQTYIARTLIMLQEGQVADPLNYGGRALRRTQLRGAALDALLKSDRVLEGAIRDFYSDQKPLTRKQLEDEKTSLRKEIVVGVVGQEFINIELRQTNPNGLADRLTIIVTRFLERLFSKQDAIMTARQFALQQRKHDLESSEQTLIAWFGRHQPLIKTSASAASVEQLLSLQKARSAAEKKLINAAASVIQGPAEMTKIIATLTQAKQYPLRFSSGNATSTLPQDMQQLVAFLDSYQETNKSLNKALRTLVAITETNLQSSNLAVSPTHQEFENLVSRYNENRRQLATHSARAGNARAPTLPPFGLINPELIRIIDKPQDPTSPATSILKIIIACMAAGIGLGIGLAALAEQVDDTLYETRGLSHLTGIDLVIPMPMADPTKDVVLASAPIPSPPT